ncbi:F-box protein At4g00755-like [Tasmannia lanceolata]|uniref:F-box protein At4g00755-like n=1 Tax=Tasmannia lanceolata TaxID=3420 RepID=UPI00406313B7
MERVGDFLELIGHDLSMDVLMCLDDPSDIARASSVSHSWRRFVIAKSFYKKLCIKRFPEISCFTHVTEICDSMEPIEVGASNYIEWECLERDHRVYARLARALTSPRQMKDRLLEAINASSTDTYPEESIVNTLYPNDNRVDGRLSYWSSKGNIDPEVSETLTYRLTSKLCVVNEIKIQPFRAFFQHRHPTYPAKAVRFKMGHSKTLLGRTNNMMDGIPSVQRSADDDFIWTYVSSKFPMRQEYRLQAFKLPQPVLCIGGILQIELLGMVQKQEMDGLYYVRVRQVQVKGRPLSRAFDVGTLDFARKCVLKYSAHAPITASGGGATGWPSFATSIKERRAARVWNRAMQNIWHGSDSDEEEVA